MEWTAVNVLLLLFLMIMEQNFTIQFKKNSRELKYILVSSVCIFTV